MKSSSLKNENQLLLQATIDPEAFAEIYDYYFTRVYNYVRSRVNRSSVADDLTSQIFERVLFKLDKFHPERGSFGTWLFTIAHNIITDYLRNQEQRHTVSLDAVRELACARNGPEEAYILQESQQDLQAALELLNNRERNLIGLKFWAGLNNRQIAQMTGLSESNVGVILYRSIRRLQLALKKEAFENE